MWEIHWFLAQLDKDIDNCLALHNDSKWATLKGRNDTLWFYRRFYCISDYFLSAVSSWCLVILLPWRPDFYLLCEIEWMNFTSHHKNWTGNWRVFYSRAKNCRIKICMTCLKSCSQIATNYYFYYEMISIIYCHCDLNFPFVTATLLKPFWVECRILTENCWALKDVWQSFTVYSESKDSLSYETIRPFAACSSCDFVVDSAYGWLLAFFTNIQVSETHLRLMEQVRGWNLIIRRGREIHGTLVCCCSVSAGDVTSYL